MGFLVIQVGSGSNDVGSQAVFTQNAAAVGIDNVDPSDPPTNRREHSWVPFQVTLLQSAFRVSVAPGSGRSQLYRVHRGAGDSIGEIQTLADPATTVVTDLSLESQIPPLDPTDDTSIRDTWHYLTFWVPTGGNAAGNGIRAYEYATPDHPDVNWYVCAVGGDSATASFTATGDGAYAAIVDQSIVSTSTTQAAKQIPLPAGTIRFPYAVWRGWTDTSTIEAVLQQNGVDTAIAFTMVGGATSTPYQAEIDSDTTLEVADGDVLNWRIKRTAGAATTGSVCLGLGFVPAG
jgi:hypothetical protein